MPSKERLHTRPPRLVFLYSPEWLQMAERIEAATGRIILNPRNLNANSLDEVDTRWLDDRETWRALKKFQEQAPIRERMMSMGGRSMAGGGNNGR